MATNTDNAVRCVKLLERLVRNSAFIHISYDLEDAEFYLIVVPQSFRGHRTYALGSALSDCILLANGEELKRTCSRCKVEKSVKLFPPPYPRRSGEDWTMQNSSACTVCVAEKIKEGRAKKRKKLKLAETQIMRA